MWAAPSLVTVGAQAFAATGSQSPSLVTYDLRDYFTGNTQPTGPFSVFESTGPLVIGVLTQPRTFVKDPGFSSSAAFPLLVRNISNETHSQGGYSNPPGGIVGHPGEGTDLLIRFTTPAAGAFRVRLSLTDAEAGTDGVTYAVYLNGVLVPGGAGSAPDSGSASDVVITAPGSSGTIDLVIGRGTNYFGDGTRISLAVDQI